MCIGANPRELAEQALQAAAAAAGAAQGFKDGAYEQPAQQRTTFESFFDFDDLALTAPCAMGGAASSTAAADQESTADEKRRMQIEAGYHAGLLDEGIELPSFFEEDALMDDSFFQDLTASFNNINDQSSDDSRTDSTASPFSDSSCEPEPKSDVPCYKPLECRVVRQEAAPVKAEVRTPPPARVRPAAAHAPTQRQSSKAKAAAAALAVADDGKLCKWRRRDIQKHLAGERSRRAKRMGKIHTLQAMIEGLPKKPTVNQILEAAIAEIQRVKAEGAPAQGAPRAAPWVDFKEVLRSSPTLATLVLDSNNNILEASGAMLQTLRWPGPEESIVGQYLASVMHPDDAVALMREAKWFRSTTTCETSVQAVRMSATFSCFSPMPGFEDSFSSSGGFCGAFPQGYTPLACINVSICKDRMFLSVE